MTDASIDAPRAAFRRRASGPPFRNAQVFLALLIPLAVLAFWKTYFEKLGALPESMTAVVHVHAGLMFLWLLMLPAQAWLFRTGRMRLHRFVGRSSYAIVPAIIGFGLATVRHEFRRTPEAEFADAARLDFLAFGMLVAFVLTWSLGMLYRKRSQVHVRYMISTAFALGSAIVWRVFVFWLDTTPETGAAWNVAVLLVALLAFIVADWRRGVRRSPYWAVTVVVALMHVGYWTVAKSEGWLAFCEWYTG